MDVEAFPAATNMLPPTASDDMSPKPLNGLNPYIVSSAENGGQRTKFMESFEQMRMDSERAATMYKNNVRPAEIQQERVEREQLHVRFLTEEEKKRAEAAAKCKDSLPSVPTSSATPVVINGFQPPPGTVTATPATGNPRVNERKRRAPTTAQSENPSKYMGMTGITGENADWGQCLQQMRGMSGNGMHPVPNHANIQPPPGYPGYGPGFPGYHPAYAQYPGYGPPGAVAPMHPAMAGHPHMRQQGMPPVPYPTGSRAPLPTPPHIATAHIPPGMPNGNSSGPGSVGTPPMIMSQPSTSFAAAGDLKQEPSSVNGAGPSSVGAASVHTPPTSNANKMNSPTPTSECEQYPNDPLCDIDISNVDTLVDAVGGGLSESEKLEDLGSNVLDGLEDEIAPPEPSPSSHSLTSPMMGNQHITSPLAMTSCTTQVTSPANGTLANGLVPSPATSQGPMQSSPYHPTSSTPSATMPPLGPPLCTSTPTTSAGPYPTAESSVPMAYPNPQQQAMFYQQQAAAQRGQMMFAGHPMAYKNAPMIDQRPPNGMMHPQMRMRYGPNGAPYPMQAGPPMYTITPQQQQQHVMKMQQMRMQQSGYGPPMVVPAGGYYQGPPGYYSAPGYSNPAVQ